MKINKIIKKIENDPENSQFNQKGYKPILMINPLAKILIIGQAPGLKTQIANEVFLDKSGDRLRSWLGVSKEEFYNSNDFAVLPLDFYFPGKAKSGDLPPRKDFAKKWHPMLIKQMPNIKLVILAGTYAQKEYLQKERKENLTSTVKAYRQYLPKYFPIVHPSPINQRWEKKNPFFQKEVLPYLQNLIKSIRKKD